MLEPLQPFRTVREVLDQVLAAHVRSLKRYGAAVARCDDHRRAAVLTYLRRCESELVAAIARYEATDDDALKSFIQSVPVAAFAQAEAPGTVAGDLDAVLGDHRQRHQALIQLYEQIAALVGPRAQEIFVDLAEMERHNQQRLQPAVLDF